MRCTRCDDTGMEWVIEEDTESGQWHRVKRPCKCTRRRSWPFLLIALAALLVGIAPAVYLGLR